MIVNIKQPAAWLKRSVAALLCGITLLACSPQPDFHLLSGEKKRLGDYRGQWLVVNFWAEWCKPCLEELPELNAFHRQGKQQNMTLIGVSFDPISNQQLTQQVAKWRIEYPVVATEPMPIMPFKMPKALPANYLISPSGQVLGPLMGKQTKESLIQAIRTAESQLAQHSRSLEKAPTAD